LKRKKKSYHTSREKWRLSGVICAGSRWVRENAVPFEINFSAINPFHAERVALGRLKAFARRTKEAAKRSKFLLKAVFLMNGKKGFFLKSHLNNKSLLFAKQAHTVFEECCIPRTIMIRRNFCDGKRTGKTEKTGISLR
jgi:hypothetical protein